MNKFDSSRAGMLSRLGSSQVKRDVSPLSPHPGSDSTKSTEKDIFRYSYNLGKQRTRQFHRTASLASDLSGSISQTSQEDTFSKAALSRRRALSRSMSVESETSLTYSQKRETSEDVILESKNDVVRQSALKVALEGSTETGKIETMEIKPDKTTIEKNSPPGKFEKEMISDNEECPKSTPIIAGKDCIKLGDIRAKPHSFSDSVPDLRLVANSESGITKRENFSGFMARDSVAEKSQPRAICKLRRAARRLGVSLSSEELYHKQRRNGVCTEIDDAADNRKLLRVLNKRF